MLRDAQIIGCADIPRYADMPLLPLLVYTIWSTYLSEIKHNYYYFITVIIAINIVIVFIIVVIIIVTVVVKLL